MMGACIPVLRVLIRDVRKGATDDSAQGPRPFTGWMSWMGNGGTPTAVASGSATRGRQRSDNLSDKSILDSGAGDPAGILRTNDVDVEYQHHKEHVFQHHSNAFELQKVP